jgi:hypothetical protein
MKKHNARSPRKGRLLPDDLPLFACARVRERATESQPLAIRVLSRRYGLSPFRARLIAELMGLPEEVRQ